MDSLSRPLIAMYSLSNSILGPAIADLSDEEAKVRSRGGEGPSISWTIGHLCHYKVKVLELLGQSRENPFAGTFEHSATDGKGYPLLGDLAASFSTLTGELCEALGSSSDRLEAPMP